jgi:hypothetical protein
MLSLRLQGLELTFDREADRSFEVAIVAEVREHARHGKKLPTWQVADGILLPKNSTLRRQALLLRELKPAFKPVKQGF